MAHNINPNKTLRNKKPAKNEHKCKECDATFRTARELSGHITRHGGLTCDICHKVFTQYGNLKIHKIRHTGIKSNLRIIFILTNFN